MNIKKNGELHKNFYAPTPTENNNEAGVSTIRRNYSKLNFIKYHCKCQENPSKNRGYYGKAFILASEIRSCKSGNYKASIVSTPTKYETYNLPQHADILYNYVPTKGAPLPNDINMIIENLLNLTIKEKDEFPQSAKWSGSKIQKH